jgi:hypothetical protein
MRSFVRFATLLSSFAIVFAFGCRGGDDDGGGSDGGRNDGNQGGMTIQQIQTPPGPGVGSPVELHGVVVTAVDRFGGRQGGFYVEEPGGGPYSGVFVFTGNTSAVAGLEPGDEVSITGAVVDEFALMTDTSGRKLTEVADPTGGMMTITETGTAALPAPMVIDPRTLVDDDTEQSEAEKWESVLIQLANVAVTGAPRPVSMTDPTLKEMRITGPFRVGSSLVDLPDTIAVDTCYASMTGVVDYFFDYRLLPRSAADLVGGGSGCPAPEAGETTCMDTMDNDADGFVDCQDRSCQVLPMCVLDATIPDVQMQMGSFTVGTRVRLSNVTVTAVASSLFWVQSSNNPYSGVAVFPMTAPTTLAVGDRVDVEATIDEYFDVTELTDATSRRTARPARPPPSRCPSRPSTPTPAPRCTKACWCG